MASNLYGYNDYSGPKITGDTLTDRELVLAVALEASETQQHDDDDDDHDPLRSGLWMEGDSLAPPCGTSVSTIHKILRLASVSADDVVYDLGCGDGRVCLEALVQHQCRNCVGVEIELDLVDRFRELIATLPPSLLTTTSTTVTTTTTEKETDEPKQQHRQHTVVPRIFAIHSDLREVLSALLVQLAAADKTIVDDNHSNEVEVAATTTPTGTPLLHLPIPSVIFLYLLPESIAQLESSLISLLQQIPRLRLVMNTWGLASLPAAQTVQVWEDDAACVSSQILIYDKQSLGKDGQA